jgi:hypothetical protein
MALAFFYLQHRWAGGGLGWVAMRHVHICNAMVTREISTLFECLVVCNRCRRDVNRALSHWETGVEWCDGWPVYISRTGREVREGADGRGVSEGLPVLNWVIKLGVFLRDTFGIVKAGCYGVMVHAVYLPACVTLRDRHTIFPILLVTSSPSSFQPLSQPLDHPSRILQPRSSINYGAVN